MYTYIYVYIYIGFIGGGLKSIGLQRVGHD